MAPVSRSVLAPNLGLYLDRPVLSVPKGALRDCFNVRVKNGKLSNLNMGWEVFGNFSPLNGAVTLIDNFFIRSGAQTLIFGTPSDLYRYNEIDGTVTFLTPTYSVGTVSVSATDPAVVTGVGTAFVTAGLKPGDEISFGAAGERDPDATWYTIDVVGSETSLTLTGAVVGAPLAGVAYTSRVMFTGFIEDYWRTEIFFNDPSGDDVWYATNGVDPIVRYTVGDDEVTRLTGLGFTCKALKAYKNMMIYGHIIDDLGDVFPNTIINSDVGNPENVATGLASQFIVHDGVDPINTMEALGDNLVIYAQRAAVLAQFVGDPIIFAFRVAVAGLGPIAGRLIADFGDFHEFLGSDSMYRFDGVTITEVAYQVFREVIRRQDPARRELGFVHFDEENGDLIWVIPLSDDPTPSGADPLDTPPAQAWPSHYLEDVPQGAEDPVTRRSFPFTSSGFFERQQTLTWNQLTQMWSELNFRWNDQFFLAAFPFNLVGAVDGRVFTLNTNQLADGSPLESFAHTGRMALGDGRMRGLLSRIYPFARQITGNLHVLSYFSDHASGPNTTVEDLTFDTSLPEGGHFVTPYRRGRYFELEFRTNDGTPWELDGWDYDARIGGRR